MLRCVVHCAVRSTIRCAVCSAVRYAVRWVVRCAMRCPVRYAVLSTVRYALRIRLRYNRPYSSTCCRDTENLRAWSTRKPVITTRRRPEALDVHSIITGNLDYPVLIGFDLQSTR